MKPKIVLANDNVAINLEVIIDFLNSVSSFFIFEQYAGDILIEDEVITEGTYSNLDVDIDDGHVGSQSQGALRRADADVPRVAGHLADVGHLVCNRLHTDHGVRGFALNPSWVEHPGIQGHPNHPTAPDDGLELLVRKLPISGDQSAAIVVTGQHRPLKDVQRLPKGLVREMGDIQNHAD